jgi:hypothetical protein
MAPTCKIVAQIAPNKTQGLTIRADPVTNHLHVKFIINAEYAINSYLESLMNIVPKYTVKSIDTIWKSAVSLDGQKCVTYYMNCIFTKEFELFGQARFQQPVGFQHHSILAQPAPISRPSPNPLPPAIFGTAQSTHVDHQIDLSDQPGPSTVVNPVVKNNIPTNPKIKMWAKIIKEEFMCNMSHPNFAATGSHKKRVAIHNFIRSSLNEPTMTMEEAIQVAALV